jgi:ferredoxin-NADP reductase
MRKYKMCLGWEYRLKNILSFKKYWSGKIWQFRFMEEYGFDLDFRNGDFLESMLNKKEKQSFQMRKDLLKRKN